VTVEVAMTGPAAWTAEEKVEELQNAAVALAAAFQRGRDAGRQGRDHADDLARARALADRLVSLSSAASAALGKLGRG
jgi:hypothetical protein